jgi:KDO2-lipid IV(A) lauroyltransferase
VIILRLLAKLPLSFLHRLGAGLGWLVYALSPAYRRHLRENIGQAGFLDALPEAVAEAGKTALELPKLWLRPSSEVVALIKAVSGWALVEEAWQAGRGILFFTPHLGCFEITAQYYASFRPITVLYRPPKQAWLRPLVEAGRGARLKLAPADGRGVRKLLNALKAGEAVGMLPDQAPGVGEGAWAPFFGRPAWTMTLAARLAQTEVTVILAWAERLPRGAGFHLHLTRPSGPITTPAELNREIENLIRRCPGQYLWGYNRYKTPRGASRR